MVLHLSAGESQTSVVFRQRIRVPLAGPRSGTMRTRLHLSHSRAPNAQNTHLKLMSGCLSQLWHPVPSNNRNFCAEVIVGGVSLSPFSKLSSNRFARAHKVSHMSANNPPSSHTFLNVLLTDGSASSVRACVRTKSKRCPASVRCVAPVVVAPVNVIRSSCWPVSPGTLRALVRIEHSHDIQALVRRCRFSGFGRPIRQRPRRTRRPGRRTRENVER